MRISWVYVLDLADDDRIYIGSTNNLIRRVQQHKGGWKGSYLTGKYNFKSIVRCYPCILLSHARLLEEYLQYCCSATDNFPLPICGGIDNTNQLIAIAQANPEKRIKYSRWKREFIQWDTEPMRRKYKSI